MGHRVFNAVVVVFWLSTMTWLIVAKVLPPLQVGDPPNYRSVYAVDSQAKPEPVCWDMLWNDRRMGWAKTTVYRTHSGVTEVRSLVHFSHVPVDELVPPWIRPALCRRAVGWQSGDGRPEHARDRSVRSPLADLLDLECRGLRAVDCHPRQGARNHAVG